MIHWLELASCSVRGLHIADYLQLNRIMYRIMERMKERDEEESERLANEEK